MERQVDGERDKGREGKNEGTGCERTKGEVGGMNGGDGRTNGGDGRTNGGGG